MGAYFAKSLLDPLNVSANQTTIAKIETKQEKAPEAIIKTSEGIDAYDRKDTETARVVLEEAKALDPTNEVVAEYLAKLVVNTAKFKILTEMYYPNSNPAYLGIIKYDKIDLLYIWGLNINPLPTNLIESDQRVNIAYQFPVGKNLGLSIEAMTPNRILNFVWYGTGTTDQTALTNWGGVFSFGWAPSDFFSWGFGVSLYYQARWQGVPIAFIDAFFRQAFFLGFLFKNQNSTIIYDFFAGYPLERIVYLDPSDGSTRELLPPMFLENTLTVALADRTVFLILKQLNDIAFGRQFYFGRLSGAIEWWPAVWFSFYFSAEGCFGLLEGITQFGYGGSAGITFRIPGTGWAGWDFDFGISYRQRPSRNMSGEMYNECFIKVGISKTASFMTR